MAMTVVVSLCRSLVDGMRLFFLVSIYISRQGTMNDCASARAPFEKLHASRLSDKTFGTVSPT